MQSQWAFARFTVLPECACICAFNSKNSVIGNFHFKINSYFESFQLLTPIYEQFFQLYVSMVPFINMFSTQTEVVIETLSMFFWMIFLTKTVEYNLLKMLNVEYYFYLLF